MKRFFITSAIFLAVVFTSCEQFEQGGLQFEYSWSDSEGKEIEPPELDDFYAWAELLYKGEQKTTGPVAMADEGAVLRFENLPYDTAMVMKMTIRISEVAGKAPEARSDNVAYYCTSQEFKLKRGKVTVVNNGCKMEPGPALSEENSPTSPELKIAFDKGSEKVEVSSETEMKTPSNKVEVLFKAPNDLFNTVILANDTGFAVGKKEFPRPAKGDDGYYRISGYDLNDGLPFTNDGSRIVAIKLRNHEGFESLQSSITVFLDTTAPVLNIKNDAPAYNGSSTVVVTVSSNETLAELPVIGLYDSDSNMLRDLTETAEVLQKGISFRYQLAVAGNLEDGDYKVKVKGSDIVDNMSNEFETELFSVDSLSPELDGEPNITPARVAENREYSVTFSTKEDMSEGSVTVNRKEEILTCTSVGNDYTCTGKTEESSGDSIDPVVITLSDKAGNTATFNAGTIFVDRTAPSIISAILNPEYAKEGTKISISVIFDEPVKDLNLSDDGLGLICSTGGDSLRYSCEYFVKSTDTEKGYAIVVSANDIAGNPLADGAIGTVYVDLTPPQIEISTCLVTTRSGITKNGIAAATTGDTVEVALEMSIESGIEPLITLGNKPINLDCETPTDNCFAYSVTGADSEGFKFVGIDAVDLAGNYYSETVSLENCSALFDFTGPVLASAVISRIPDYAPARNYTTETLSFSLTDPFTDEPVTAQLSLFADEELSDEGIQIEGFGFGEPVEIIDNFVSFEKILSTSDTHGTKILKVKWRDVLGNYSERDINWKMFIDKSTVSADVIDMQKVLYTRKPWGTDDTGGIPKFSVAGETGAIGSSDISTIVAYNEQGSIIGQAGVTGGTFSIPALTGGDLPEIYLNPVKKSGVKATGIGALVTEISWHATMGGKVPGSEFENRHKFVSTSGWVKSLEQLVGRTVEPEIAESLKVIDSLTTVQSSEVSWQEIIESVMPSKRVNHSMVYDSARGKVVLFGGASNSHRQQDTWEWDGASNVWVNRTPGVTVPSKRRNHSMVYDPVRGKTVLFGGWANTVLNDTWEWDGVKGTWANVAPAGNSPEARFDHAMAYDFSTNKIVLYGGNEGNKQYGDTWIWDGANKTWSEITPASATPGELYGHKMVYDFTREKVVLFGGRKGGTEYNNLWEWDGSTNRWNRLTITGEKPSGRDEHSMVYDSSCGGILIFGGPYFPNNDAWFWNSTTEKWSEITLDSSAPEARSGHAMVYDNNRGKVIMFGGYNGFNFEQDLWEWDCVEEKWVERTAQNLKPEQRTGHAMVYDPVRKKIVLFGGIGDGYLQDTWLWDGETKTWSGVTDINQSPEPRSGHRMAFDEQTGTVVLFGGYGSESYENTWIWDGSKWTEKTPANHPSSRSGHSMAYDSVRKTVLLSGGFPGSDELWEWNGVTETWTPLTTVEGTPPRHYHAIVYDSSRNKTVLFGGFAGAHLSDDTWEWNGATASWSETALTGDKPSSRMRFDMVYDAMQKKVFLFGGKGSEYYDDTWQYDGTTATWKNITPAGDNPLERNDHAMAYDSNTKKTLLFSGQHFSGQIPQDVWELDSGYESKPAQIMTVVFNASGTKTENVALKSVSSTFYAGGTGFTAANCNAMNGAKMFVWNTKLNGGSWMETDENNSSSTSTGLLEFSTDDPELMHQLFFGQNESINIAVVPVSESGCGSEMGSIATDYAEVIVRYKIDE
ncbi:MAG: Kelch repeat-containing protein [bacterium]